MNIYCLSILLNSKNRKELSCFTVNNISGLYNSLRKISEVKEAIILQKCNCVEFYIFGAYSARNNVIKIWKKYSLNIKEFDENMIKSYVDRLCINHLLKTACGLESVTLGDNQVLGQIHKAYKESLQFKISGPILTKVFASVRQVAKIIKQKTGIGLGNISVARSAVDILKLENQRSSSSILVIGAGEIGALVAKSLFEEGFYNVTITNRTKSKALLLIKNRYVKMYLPFDEAFNEISKFDIVFFALSLVIDRDIIEKLNFKSNALIFDLGNPSNTLYYSGKNKVIDINFIREQSEIVLMERKQKIDEANFLIHNAIPKIEESINRILVNVDINDNFHKREYLSSKTISNTEFKSKSMYYIRNFLDTKNFIEVQTPCVIAVPSDPVRYSPSKELFKCNWYDKRMFLRQSNQLYKQMLILSGFNKIYEYGPFWRAESNPTPRHLSEAWGLDVEMANVKNLQELISLIGEILNHFTVELYIDNKINKESIIKDNIPYFEYEDIVKLIKDTGINYNYGDDFGYELEEKLGKIIYKKYNYDIYAIIHFPNSIKKFYTMPKGKYTKSFDIYYKGWEISSGAIRQHNKTKLIKRMAQNGLNPDKYRFYTEKFENSRPHGGFCLGIDRILVKLLGYNNIKDMIIYPRSQKDIIP